VPKTAIIAKRFVCLLLLFVVQVAEAWSPLESLDTSSPRATMASFLALTDEAAGRWGEYRKSPSPTTQERVWDISKQAGTLFDLSQVAPALQREVSAETFYLLWEVMARVELPALDQISVTAEPNGDGDQDRRSTRWRLPHTKIAIARIDEGPQAGEYLFSADTVSNARRFYEAVRDLPYHRPMPIPDAYRFTQVATGWMIPPRIIEEMPGWANAAIFGQVVWKWAAFFALFALAFVLVALIFRRARRRRSNSLLGAYLWRMLTPAAILLLVWLIYYLGTYQINVTGAGVQMLDYVVDLVISVALVWVAWTTAASIGDVIIASPRISAESVDASLVRLAAKSAGMLAVVVLLFRFAQDIGIPVYGLVTGAGVGGLAIALAARSTLENFMGAWSLFADRPVGVGDKCRYDEDQSGEWRSVGRVESIGMRSTKIRKRDRSLLTIPNADFAQRQILNLSSCDRFLLSTRLGLRYETTDDQLRYLLAELRELLHAHPMTIHSATDPVRVRFLGFGAYSLDVAIRAYIKTSSRDEFLAIQEDILLRIMKVVRRSGTDFAFPSQTLYLGRDKGIDAGLQQGAESKVREWASAQTLPFPDFTEDYRKEITDTLDYPPEGSPGADRG
jgi:MscS family membrane protein